MLEIIDLVMSGNTNTATWYQPTVVAVPAIEFAIFQIGEVNFGLPISKIYRIIDSQNTNGTLDLPADIDRLDLHDRIFETCCLNPISQVIVNGNRQKLLSIFVDTVPILMTVPIDRIRLISEELRSQSPLKIASHIAIIFDGIKEITVFILEI